MNAPIDARLQVHKTSRVTLGNDVKRKYVVQPVVLEPSAFLCRNRQCILLRRQVAGEAESDVHFFAGFHGARVEFLDSGIGAVDIDADSSANQDADHGFYGAAVITRSDANRHLAAAEEDQRRVRPSSSSNCTSRISLDPSPCRKLDLSDGRAVRLLAIAFLAFENHADVAVDDLLGRSDSLDLSVQQKNGAVRELLHQSEVVRDEENGHAPVFELFEFADAAVGEDGVSDGECFVDDEDFRIYVNGGGERKADIHARRVFFHGAIDEGADAGELLDAGEHARDLGGAEAQDLAVEEHVLATCEFRVEAGAQFE